MSFRLMTNWGYVLILFNKFINECIENFKDRENKYHHRDALFIRTTFVINGRDWEILPKN